MLITKAIIIFLFCITISNRCEVNTVNQLTPSTFYTFYFLVSILRTCRASGFFLKELLNPYAVDYVYFLRVGARIYINGEFVHYFATNTGRDTTRIVNTKLQIKIPPIYLVLVHSKKSTYHLLVFCYNKTTTTIAINP